MKKFRFPLHSVATLRKMRENERRERFAAAVHGYVNAEEALAAVNARIVELEEIIAGERAGRFRASAQVAFMQALSDEVARKFAAAAVVAETKLLMDQARESWIEARRDVRLIETLEAKARLTYRQAFEREEQALLDDRTNALFARAV
jgi:flagellar protein FliJ